jgi:hypothetical protein
MKSFLSGGLVMACLVAALFFWRYWIRSRDRLFLYFAAAFGTLAIHWSWVGLELTPDLPLYQTYILRLVAFVLIIVGIVDKNRREQ